MSGSIIGKLVSMANGQVEAALQTTEGVVVGSYVAISEAERHIIGEIVGVTVQGSTGAKMATIHLLGEIVAARFCFGVSRMPLILSDVMLIPEEDLAVMLAVTDEEIPDASTPAMTKAKYIAIGHAAAFPAYDVRIRTDAFFGFHFAVLGNTGAGKSNTVASIIQRVFRKTGYAAKGARFIVIDANGEYAQAFSQLHEDNPAITVRTLAATEDTQAADRLEIPVWALTADDWAILLQASERTQIPILQRAIDIARHFFDEGRDSEAIKNHILASALMGILNSSDTSPSKKDKIVAVLASFYTRDINLMARIPGNFTMRDALMVSYGEMKQMAKILEYLQLFIKPDVAAKIMADKKMVRYSLQQFYEAVTFAALYEGSISSNSIEAYTTPLVTRLQAIKDGIQGNIFTLTDSFSVEEYIQKLLGDHQIINIDISMLDDLSAEVLAKVLAKLFLDYLKHRDVKADMPINFIMEEAHRFVKEEPANRVLGYNIFERIAKEGRKYGLLLGISSQRPSELSKTVISQCSNFIIHRIQNPDDLQYIAQMVPYISKDMIERLTYLQTGHALVLGTAVHIPMLTQFDQAQPGTDSANAAIMEKWYKA